ncbi:MAG: NAD(P)/FAD-dependent oxidoreductase [Anaerolineales bacterium]|nr:NAD(P)/FAD-dependent oxidoreductase [Anaerolineales bacterium]
MNIVVIGAGVGGLTAASLLLKAGHSVTVLEAHVYAGGCAGTFYHQGYRFDAGATLAGGFSPGGPHTRLAEILGLTWPVSPVDPAWVTHLPDRSITQWADAERWREERRRAFPHAEPFWRKQERLADIAWDVSSRYFPWPPESPDDLLSLIAALRPQTLLAAPYLFSTVANLAGAASRDPMFKTFLDAQLLIAAQTTSDFTHALYGSAALDLPRRGVNHVHGGIGALARTLVDWIRAHGGRVLFRQAVEKIETRYGRAVAVQTNKGLRLEADAVIANVTPWALARLLGEAAPPGLLREVRRRAPTWGAFTLYLGLDAAQLPGDVPDHHQVVVDPTRPLGEANSVFISLSAADDVHRAPAGQRVATLSTHTAVSPWLELKQRDPAAYEARKAAYTEKMLAAAERALPGLRRAVRLCLSGTPATFEFFTRRPQGMVGGFPQTSLFNVRGPATGLPNVWLVGDSIFPGQSTAGVTLGGMRVAAKVLQFTARSSRLRALQATRQPQPELG